MDSFGCATSAVTLLRDLPFNTVNIDRTLLKSLKTNSEDAEVIRTTLRLIESLGLTSVAQGVEDLEQLVVLQSAGCAYAQGRSLGDPVDFGRVIASAVILPAASSDLIAQMSGG